MDTAMLNAAWLAFDIANEVRKAPPVKESKRTRGGVDEYICMCGGLKILNCHNLPTCKKCGLVQDLYVTETAEWVSSVSDTGKVDDQARCGKAKDLELFSEKWGVGTTIKVDKNSTTAQKRASKINFHQSMNHKDRALYHAYKDIEIGASGQSLPDGIIRDAKIIYRKFNSEKLTRGAVRGGIKANCVLLACKNAGYSRTTQEIADSFGIPTRDISRTCELFKATVETKEQKKASGITKPSDVIHRLMNSFSPTEIDKQMKLECLKMCKLVEETCVDIMGKSPSSIASAIIHIKLPHLSKNDICIKCNVSAPTLTKIEALVSKHLETK
jgi:transcription initiation factor TFIIB